MKVSGISRIVLILFIVLLNIGCDQQTKQVAKDNLEHVAGGYSYLNDMFRLVYAENNGAFLSAGSDWPPIMHTLFLKVIPFALLLAMLIYTLFSTKVNTRQALALGFIIGGGASNIIDRIFYGGSVVDFMNIGIGSLRTGIFNFADVSIMIGLFALLIMNFRPEKKDVPSQEQNSILSS